MTEKLFARLKALIKGRKGMAVKNRKLNHVLDTAPVAYALVTDGILADVNKYAKRTIGMVRGESIRRYCAEADKLEELATEAAENNKPSRGLVSIALKNGENRRFHVNITSVGIKSYIIWASLAEEIESKSVSEEETELPAPADDSSQEKEANRLRGKFLTDISYEIRTPMNGIIGMTDLLLVENMSGQQIHYVTEIRASALNLMDIMNDVLDYARISEGKLRLQPVDFELCVFLKNIVLQAKVSARTKGLAFTDEINIKQPTYIKADSARLKQVIDNLLKNAVKFTREGSIVFSAEIKEENLLLRVCDTGIGVKPENVPNLFTAFRKPDNQKGGGLKSAGLGLPISKSLVEMMGGKIWLESELGVGSIFYVSIPFVKGDGSSADGSDFELMLAPDTKVLVVDDIQTNLTVTAGLLRLCGITADVALSGVSAIRLAEEKDYDIIFMDHIMPEMDGVEAMERIRALGGKNSETPIIALTASSEDEAKEYLLGAGMDGFLSKPIDKHEIMKALKKWLPENKAETTAAYEAIKNADIPAEYSGILHAVSQIEGFDVKLALSRISGMQEVLEQSIKQLYGSLNENLRNMERDLSTGNLKGFSITAHALKGSLSNIGAARYANMASELEALAKAEKFEDCGKRFGGFVNLMSKLESELSLVFSEKDSANKPSGDKAFLVEKAGLAISYLEKFEPENALELLDEMSRFTYGIADDRRLSDAKNAAKRFDYKSAISALKLL